MTVNKGPVSGVVPAAGIHLGCVFHKAEQMSFTRVIFQSQWVMLVSNNFPGISKMASHLLPSPGSSVGRHIAMGSVASLHGVEDFSCLLYLAEHIQEHAVTDHKYLKLLPARIHSLEEVMSRDRMNCS